MKTPVSLALAILSAALLAGCGSIVGSFIQPQTIDNPANLKGQVLSTSSPLRALTVAGTVAYSTASTGGFDDYQYPGNVPFNIRPHAVSLSASFAGATVGGPCAFHDSFDVTLQKFSVAVWERAKPGARAELSAEPKVTLHFTRTDSGPTSATYAAAANSVTLSGGAGVTDPAIDVLTTHDAANDNSKNDASVKAEITADQDGLAGCNVAFKLGKASLTLSDFH